MIIKTKMKCPFRDDEQCIGFMCPCYYEKKWDRYFGSCGLGYIHDGLTWGGCTVQEEWNRTAKGK